MLTKTINKISIKQAKKLRGAMNDLQCCLYPKHSSLFLPIYCSMAKLTSNSIGAITIIPEAIAFSFSEGLY